MTIHLLRMAAGLTELSELHAHIRKEKRKEKGIGEYTAIHTRNTPKRMADLLEGGSVFNIMRSMIQCRRRILDIQDVKGQDGSKWCRILLDTELVRVMPVAHKPFQGWRYLEPQKAPRDLGIYRGGDDDVPADMAEDLRAMGLL